MSKSTDDRIPTVCIANAIDTLRLTIFRAPSDDDRKRIQNANYPQQDQSIFWRPLDKLIISETPIGGFDWITSFLGIKAARNVSPKSSSGSLFRDVIDDETLQRELLNWCSEAGEFRLIVHTSTPDLWPMVDFVEKKLGLKVVLQESTPRQDFRDYLDTKTGFRDFAKALDLVDGSVCIAPGKTCRNGVQAADAVMDHLLNGRAAIVKPDRGEASVGLNIFRPGDDLSLVRTEIARNSFLGNDPIVVEEYIEYVRDQSLSFPSVEYFVPPQGKGDPHLTYACSMLFDRPTELVGNFIHPAQRNSVWFGPLVEAGLKIAKAMQQEKYVGHFDIDTVVRDSGQAILLDLNPRRTGATHVHEFAAAFLGTKYQLTYSVGAVDLYGSHPISLEELLQALGPCIRSPLTSAEGLLPCELTGLSHGRVSLMIWALSSASVLSLRRTAEDALASLDFRQVASSI